jgi:hypothetical protein
VICAIRISNRQGELKQANTHLLRCKLYRKGGAKPGVRSNEPRVLAGLCANNCGLAAVNYRNCETMHSKWNSKVTSQPGRACSGPGRSMPKMGRRTARPYCSTGISAC